MIHTKRFPWLVAQTRHQFVFWATLPIVISEAYWKTWYDAYQPATR